MIAVVTGAGGFIGSTLVDRLLQSGHKVIGVDNFSTGLRRFLLEALSNPNFKLYELDLLDESALRLAFSNSDIVFHFAANADVRFGVENTRKDLEQNTIATHNVLEAMRLNAIKRIVFSSTGSVYGVAPVIPTPENCPFPTQTSLYGASKVACEGLITAYCEAFEMKSWIFRFVSILGERYTHGHVYDFYRNLSLNPDFLGILGNGRQRKSYLYVQDCIDAIFCALEKSKDSVNIFNLGSNSYLEVNESIELICQHLNVQPQLQYTGGDVGWVGDNPFIFLDTSKILNLGWQPKHSIKQGIIKTVEFLKKNEWVFKERVDQ